MINFFRKILESKIGVYLFLGFLLLVALAFGLNDIINSINPASGISGNYVARVGGQKISSSDLRSAVDSAYRTARQENPEVTLQSFVNQGGLDAILDQLINRAAIKAYANANDIYVSKRMIDSRIATNPAFFGGDNKFSDALFRAALTNNRVSEEELRRDIEITLLIEQLIPLAQTGVEAPSTLVENYTSLLLERRKGNFAAIPAALFIKPDQPSDDELKQFYDGHSDRFTIAERRAVDYAIFDDSRFQDISASEEEIVNYYEENADLYAAQDLRKFRQIIVPTEDAANAFLTRLSEGAAIDIIAEEAGLSVTEIGPLSQSDIERQIAPAVGKAAFTLNKTNPQIIAKGELGWHLIQWNGNEIIKAKSLDDVKESIGALLAVEKRAEAMADFVLNIEDELAAGSSLKELAAAEQLDSNRSPALLATGVDPENPTYQPVPEVRQLLDTAFTLADDDAPQLIALETGRRYAIVGVAEIKAAAPPPYAQVKEAVARTYIINKAHLKTKEISDNIIQSVKDGASLDIELRKVNGRIPLAQKIDTRRSDILQAGRQVPPGIALLFAMKEGEVKKIEVPGDQGYALVQLNEIIPGDPANEPTLVAESTRQFGQFLGNEFVDQFVRSFALSVGIEYITDEIDQVRAQLGGNNREQ